MLSLSNRASTGISKKFHSIDYYASMSTREINQYILRSPANFEDSAFGLFSVHGAKACHEQERFLRAWLLRFAIDPNFQLPNFLTIPLLQERLKDLEGSILHKIYCALMICHFADPNEPILKSKTEIINAMAKWQFNLNDVNFHQFFHQIVPLTREMFYLHLPYPFTEVTDNKKNQLLLARTPTYPDEYISEVLEYGFFNNQIHISNPHFYSKIISEHYSDQHINTLVQKITSIKPSELKPNFAQFIGEFVKSASNRLTRANNEILAEWLIRCAEFEKSNCKTFIENFEKTTYPLEYQKILINCSSELALIICQKIHEMLKKDMRLGQSSSNHFTYEIMLIARHHKITDTDLMETFAEKNRKRTHSYDHCFFDLLQHAPVQQRKDEIEKILKEEKSACRSYDAILRFEISAAKYFTQSTNQTFKNELISIFIDKENFYFIYEHYFSEAAASLGYLLTSTPPEPAPITEILSISIKDPHTLHAKNLFRGLIQSSFNPDIKSIPADLLLSELDKILTSERIDLVPQALEAMGAFSRFFTEKQFNDTALKLIGYFSSSDTSVNESACRALQSFTQRNLDLDNTILEALAKAPHIKFETYACKLLQALLTDNPHLNFSSGNLFFSEIIEKFCHGNIAPVLVYIFEQENITDSEPLFRVEIDLVTAQPSSIESRIEILTSILASKTIRTNDQRVYIFNHICRLYNESTANSKNIQRILEKVLPHLLKDSINAHALCTMLKKDDACELLFINLISAAHATVRPKPDEDTVLGKRLVSSL